MGEGGEGGLCPEMEWKRISSASCNSGRFMLARIWTQLFELRYAPPCLPAQGRWACSMDVCVAEVTNTSTTRAHCLHMENLLKTGCIVGCLAQWMVFKKFLLLLSYIKPGNLKHPNHRADFDQLFKRSVCDYLNTPRCPQCELKSHLSPPLNYFWVLKRPWSAQPQRVCWQVGVTVQIAPSQSERVAL